MLSIEKYNPIDKFECIRVFESNIPEFFIDQELIDFKSWIGKNNCQDFYVLKKDGIIIGFGGFYFENRKARLVYGIIHNQHQKMGHGKRLINYRIGKIREKDRDITIGLETKKLTYNYFEKLGFKLIEIIPKYYYSTIDKYEMVLHSVTDQNEKIKTPANKK